MGFQWYYLFAALEPLTGESFLLELPALNADTFQVFLNEFQRSSPDSVNVMVLDRGAFHSAKALRPPKNLILLF